MDKRKIVFGTCEHLWSINDRLGMRQRLLAEEKMLVMEIVGGWSKLKRRKDEDKQ